MQLWSGPGGSRTHKPRFLRPVHMPVLVQGHLVIRISFPCDARCRSRTRERSPSPCLRPPGTLRHPRAVGSPGPAPSSPEPVRGLLRGPSHRWTSPGDEACIAPRTSPARQHVAALTRTRSDDRPSSEGQRDQVEGRLPYRSRRRPCPRTTPHDDAAPRAAGTRPAVQGWRKACRNDTPEPNGSATILNCGVGVTRIERAWACSRSRWAAITPHSAAVRSSLTRAVKPFAG